jgi:hypothetical protein
MLLLEVAQATECCATVETALFSALGAQSISASNDALCVALHRSARAHGERAQALRDRLPVSDSLPRSRFVEAVPAGLGTVVQAFRRAVDEAGGGGGPLGGHPASTVLLPALAAAYDELLASTQPSSDAPLRAVLVPAALAPRAEQGELAALLGPLEVGEPTWFAAATEAAAELSGALGGGAGPGTLWSPP